MAISTQPVSAASRAGCVHADSDGNVRANNAKNCPLSCIVFIFGNRKVLREQVLALPGKDLSEIIGLDFIHINHCQDKARDHIDTPLLPYEQCSACYRFFRFFLITSCHFPENRTEKIFLIYVQKYM